MNRRGTAGGSPLRIYAVGLLDATGLGMYLSFAAVYLNQALDLSNSHVALILGTAGVGSLLGAIPVARFADRCGLRRALVILFAARALSYVGLSMAAGLWTAMAAAAFGGLLNRGIGPLVQTALIDGLRHEDAVAPLARLRALRNAGMALGALPTGVAVAVGDELAYRAIMGASATVFVLCAVLSWSLPRAASSGARRLGKPGLVGNGPFLRVTALYSALILSAILLGTGMALWITQQTDLPHWMVSTNYVLNTVLVVVFQARLARGSESPLTARRMMVAGGLLAAGGAAVASLTGRGDGWPPVALMLLAVVLMTGAEIYVMAGATSLALVHTPQEHRSTYLATFNLGFGVATVVGPSLISISLDHDAAGWLAWAVFLALAAVASLTLPLAPPGADGPRRKAEGAPRRTTEGDRA
ncbi:MFS transporter [Streptomyces sp. CA2R101]|uniref:MFS transporter n=1 Tax=Streptomyces sp. CA2R101 TaxID=3120152 RepID=UPI00300ACF9C